MYFVTICTKNREEFFGEIIDGKMILNEIGKIAENCLQEIPQHFPHANASEFVVMPNHVHVVIEINWNNIQQCVETQNFASLQCLTDFASLPCPQNKFGSQSKNLASIIRGFKIGVKKYATINDLNFTWQPRFYDHVIRNDESLNKIREYIQTNPEMWERDRNNIENVWI